MNDRLWWVSALRTGECLEGGGAERKSKNTKKNTKKSWKELIL
jgi:hypothetical protein